MIITHITLEIEKIPLRTPFITALRRVDDVENIRIAIHTDTPNIGYGAAPATKAITGEGLKTIAHTIKKSIAPKLVGETFELTGLLKLLHTCCKGNSSAKAAVDMALYDLAAVSDNSSLVAFLGASPKPLQSAVTISLKSPQEMADDAREAYGRGFDILKVKVGGRDGLDIARIETVREAVPEARLLIDANQAWDVDESLHIIKAIAPLNIELIEQPVVGSDIEGLRQITEKSPIAILADEAVFTLEDAKKVVENRAADLINIKLMKCGGISRAIEIIEYCRKNGVKCMMGSMLEGPTSIALTAQLVMAYSDAFSHIDLDSPLLYKKIPTGTGLQFFNNTITLEEDDIYSLYILQCSDNSFYTGIAKELDKRLDEHNNSPKGAKYTKARRPVKVVYEEKHRSKSSALKRELEIKKMSRSQKERLISLQQR
ncbi:enolase C-terminal domain-like protein [Sulfurimonas sp. HSL3-7]|uniref:enolase C-terminal domain-like protein n=1 Tax=Sulfonitrofixus jiaomeiensis TaxID=3131938 RepID=UPI0031F95173